VRRSNKAVKGKLKVAAKKAKPVIKGKAVPERIRSDRYVEEVRPNAEKLVTDGMAGNVVHLTDPAISLAGNADRLRGPETGAIQAYPHGTAAVFAALQALFLLPLRSLQTWQEAWFRLLPR